MALLRPEDITGFIAQAAAEPGQVDEALRQAVGIANRFCFRQFEVASWDEYHDVDQDQDELLLKQRPVTAISTVTTDPDGVPLELLTTDYSYAEEIGIVYRIGAYWPEGRRMVRVQYSAGYTETTCPDDLRAAIMELVAWRLGFRGAAGVTTESADGVSQTKEPMVRGIPASIAGMLEGYGGYA